HETVDDLLLAGLVEGDGELVAVDLDHVAIAEFLVEDAVIERELGRRSRRLGNQLALDRHRTVPARKAAAEVGRERRSPLPKAAASAAAGLSAGAIGLGTVGLGALPARGRIARAEGLHVVEARGAIAAGAAPGRAALGFRDLDIGCRQFV